MYLKEHIVCSLYMQLCCTHNYITSISHLFFYITGNRGCCNLKLETEVFASALKSFVNVWQTPVAVTDDM